MKSMWKVYVLALISFLIGTSQFATSGFLDQIASSMGITVSKAGQFTTVYALTYAIATPLLISLTAKMDQRKLTLYSLGIFIVGNLLSYFSTSFVLFTSSRIICAIGAGVVIVTALTIEAKIAPVGKQASSIATVTIGFTLALIIGVPFGRLLSSAFGWRSVFLDISLFGVIATIIIIAVIPKVQGEEPIPLIKQLALLKNPKVLLGLFITLFWLSGYALVYIYISPYLLKGLGLSEDLLSPALLVFGVACFVGSEAGGYCADKYGITGTLLVSMSLDISSLIFLSLSAYHSIIIFVFLFLWSASVWSIQPAQLLNLATLVPAQSGIMLSLNQSISQISMAIGAALGGAMINTFPLVSLSWFGNIGVIIALSLVWRLHRLKTIKGKQNNSSAI
ncbi:MFS transporter [Sporolactobacillus nakayamae]|uniref:MFS transporter, DHA1 family, purine base/nucleoside efflux pump n=1 Tax=Sporolactobacillus nakayamae TaxID=269670 RepID=A0A1I2V4F4_9BACL|nr:MFS transporter [Sporolactobacillus nakayamae]SFG83913.1 MFS transporter, DHA1 family, purine base/nucleoside efflux pump [Sporolactobacillus nakayamae]